MTDALVAVVEDVGGVPSSAETRRKLRWTCREVLGDFAAHPRISHVLFVEEWSPSPQRHLGVELRPWFGEERASPRTAQQLPKCPMGTGLVNGFAPGCAREVIGQEPSSRWLAMRNETPRRISDRSRSAPARLSA